MKRIFITLLLSFYSFGAVAAGNITHAIMTDEARKNVVPQALKDLLDDNKPYWIVGSVLPDGGYIHKFSYAEPAHWPAFHVPYFKHIFALCQGQLDAPRCEQLIAHFLGMVAHGFEDESYDILMDNRSQLVDPPEGDSLLEKRDTMIDKYSVWDYNRAFHLLPTAVSPLDDVFQVFTEMRTRNVEMSHLQVGEATMITAASLQRNIVDFFTNYVDSQKYPWLRQSYITEAGGVEYTGRALANLWEFYWEKLNGRSKAPDVTVYPPDDGFLNPNRHDPWGRFTFLSDRPLQSYSLWSGFYVEDDQGQRVSGNVRVRDGYVVTFNPSVSLVEGQRYRAVLSTRIKDYWGNPIFPEDFHWEVVVSEKNN
ncbi:Ig-like domain-containing protein [Endozoicomonas arenosclerae]|uniref:Ig-like domain-containing protein n=1 Tax=Endozoicomonas arenosclerae TaxID=1633495 RepID=UPI000782C64F|nr:Ig-like domain-containing protein [Endozoicomonas arenosclerae]